jgi:predicted DCC family thiol-disulfide oxidoreductase YuxK
MNKSNYLLIYDEGCPLCVAYTGFFVKTGFMSAEERKSFTEAGDQWLNLADFKRSRNEIPLLNTSTGETLYGIDALLEILNRKIPFIKTIGSISFVKYFLVRLYKLISYNRKVIVGNKTKFSCVDCTPDFHSFYRLLFMLFFLVFNTVMLWPIHNNILLKIPVYTFSFFQLQLAHFTLVVFNIAISSLLGLKKGFEYMGQANMLAVSTVLLVLPLVLLNKTAHFSFWFDAVYLSGVAIIIVSEYFRRIDFAGLKNNKALVAVNLISFITFLLLLF